jgi:hypothetical protein
MDTRCLLVRSVPKQPWVLSTNMHYHQGAVDLASVAYDAASGRLSGKALRHPGAEGTLTLYVPEGYRLKQASVPVRSAKEGKNPRVVCLKLAFKSKEQPWSATFAQTEK